MSQSHQSSTQNSAQSSALSIHQLDGVRRRRVMAFLLDYVLIFFVGGALYFIFSILTLGLGFLLGAVLVPVLILLYIGLTLGGDNQATPGMRFFGVKLVRYDGRQIDFFTAIIYAVVFWVLHSGTLFWLLLISLFTRDKGLVQDVIFGTAAIRSDI